MLSEPVLLRDVLPKAMADIRLRMAIRQGRSPALETQGDLRRSRPRAIICFLIIFIVSGCESLMPHPRPWTEREKIAAGFFIAAHAFNAYSTERHQDYPEYFCERNSLMGKHPTDKEIAAYFSITGIGALLIAHYYPELREPLLFGYGGMNLGLAIDDLKAIKEKRHRRH